MDVIERYGCGGGGMDVKVDGCGGGGMDVVVDGCGSVMDVVVVLWM